jgi:hypothetical protein
MSTKVLNFGLGFSKLEENQLMILTTCPRWKEEGVHC